MNFFKRAIYSLKRRPAKSALLFAIIFVLSNVMAGAISVRQGADNVETSIKKNLGAAYIIEYDWLQAEKDGYMPEKGPEQPSLETLKAIGASPYVKNFDYTLNGYGLTSKTLTYYYPADAPADMQEQYEQNKQWYSFNMKGTQYAPMLLIEEGKYKLLSGRVFTQEEVDNGKNVILMDKKLADLNNVNADDTVILSQNIYDYSSEPAVDGMPKIKETIDYPFKVIGIYDSGQITMPKSNLPDGNDYMRYDLEMQTVNTLYAPNNAVQVMNDRQLEVYFAENPNLTEEEKEMARKPYYSPLFILKNPDDMAAFETENQPLLPKYQKLKSNSSSFDKISGPLQSTRKLAGYVLYAAIAASILIITLVVLLFLRDRKHELGIYMSLGEKKGKILGQILAEVLIIALIAISLSIFSGNILAKGISESMVKTQIAADTGNTNDPWEDFNNYMNDRYTFGEFASAVGRDELAENYKITLSPAYLALIFGIGVLTVLLSTIAPILYILRLNPKKVLM